MVSKNRLANDKYGCDFEDLSGGEKAGITKKYNAQVSATRTRVSPVARAVGVKATIGRVGYNGSKTCILVAGSDVQDLINQANFAIDSKKESVVAESTGHAVTLSTKVKAGETYVITAEIKSA